MKPSYFFKADISLISTKLTKFHHDRLQRRYYILNKKVLNNLIMKTQYNYYSSSSDKNANKDTITTSFTTKNDLVNSPKENMSETSTAKNNATTLSKTLQTLSIISKIRERGITNSIKIKNAPHALSVASKLLNDFTGYSIVEELKEKVIQQEKEFAATRQNLASAKLAYEEAVTKRSATQREINDLLQRKNQWTADDVARFTELYRNEHVNEQAETAAKGEFHKYEKQVEKEYTDLTRSIMTRYHEEQVWSDKIRSASTYGTIALMTLNIILFICVQTIFEPRKRQTLADKFEELLIKKLDENDNKLETGIFVPLYQKFERMDERINQFISANYPFSFRKQNDSVVGLETKQIEMESSLENELSINDNLLDDSEKPIEETYDSQKDISLTRGELDKIVILSTLMGAGAGWLLSFIFSERFNR